MRTLQALLLTCLTLSAQPLRYFSTADSLTPVPNGIELRSASAVMSITALRDDVLRIRFGPDGQLPEDAS
jgi:hypothetical protein